MYIVYVYILITSIICPTGSPFVLRISGAPDASKVRVSGPGIEHGILATYQSRFIVETRGAGAGQLTVRIRGPKGNKLIFTSTVYIFMITMCDSSC